MATIEHEDIVSADCHEPKHITAATGGASDVGKVIVSKGDGTSELRRLAFEEIDDAPSLDDTKKGIIQCAVSPTIAYSNGISGVSRVQQGVFRITWTTPFADALYVVHLTDENAANKARTITVSSRTAADVTFVIRRMEEAFGSNSSHDCEVVDGDYVHITAAK